MAVEMKTEDELITQDLNALFDLGLVELDGDEIVLGCRGRGLSEFEFCMAVFDIAESESLLGVLGLPPLQ